MPDDLVIRMRPYATSVFGDYSALAAKLGAINLGQGFPDTDGPPALLAAAADAILSGHGNQYPPSTGILPLREAIAAYHRRQGLDVEPVDGVVVGTGASEIIVAAILALVEPGQTVALIDPAFDIYAAGVALAGAQAVRVPMSPLPEVDGEPAGFGLDVELLAAQLPRQTRLLVLNSPHNPLATVLNRSTLAAIAELAVARDLLVISDEVYHHLVYDPAQPHIPLATLPGMAERTLTIGSAGKLFSVTGWKVGWAVGTSSLIAAVRAVRQHLSYASGGPFQYAIAAVLGDLAMTDAWLAELTTGLAARRNELSEGLRAAGHRVHPAPGTYFVVSEVPRNGSHHGDAAQWCRELPERVGVVAIPVSVFAENSLPWQRYVRWAFCKQPAVIAAACQRLDR